MTRKYLGLLFCGLAGTAGANPSVTLEALLGVADQELLLNDGFWTSADAISKGGRIAYGLNPNIALELLYQNYGEATESYYDTDGENVIDRMDAASLNLGLKASLPLAQAFSVVGRLGLSRWYLDFTETDTAFPGQPLLSHDTGVSLYYGLGIEYALHKEIFIGLEYTLMSADVDLLGIEGEHNLSNLSASIGYRF